MWLKRSPAWIVIGCYIIIGLVVGILISFSEILATDHATPACVDTMDQITMPVDVLGPCEPRQSMQYLRDFNGDRYIMCRCPGHVPQQDTLVPIIPYLDDIKRDAERKNVTPSNPKRKGIEL